MNPIVLPRTCEECNSIIVHGCKFTEDMTWRALLIVANVALFQVVAADRVVQERSEGKAANLSLVLAEIGCLACYMTDVRDAFVAEVLDKGFEDVASRVRTGAYQPDRGASDGRR